VGFPAGSPWLHFGKHIGTSSCTHLTPALGRRWPWSGPRGVLHRHHRLWGASASVSHRLVTTILEDCSPRWTLISGSRFVTLKMTALPPHRHTIAAPDPSCLKSDSVDTKFGTGYAPCPSMTTCDGSGEWGEVAQRQATLVTDAVEELECGQDRLFGGSLSVLTLSGVLEYGQDRSSRGSSSPLVLPGVTTCSQDRSSRSSSSPVDLLGWFECGRDRSERSPSSSQYSPGRLEGGQDHLCGRMAAKMIWPTAVDNGRPSSRTP